MAFVYGYLNSSYSYYFIYSSGALKEEYERLKTDMLKAEEETNFTYLKKRGVVAERKEAKLEKEEAEKYQKLKKDLVHEY